MATPTTILGIETSCDETAAAVVRRHADGSGEILSNVVLSQVKDHAPYGGVVPEVAARAHIRHLDKLITSAMAEAQTTITGLAAIAATAGPGLSGGLIVGLTMAKGMALAAGKPFLAINHLEGHALTPRLMGNCPFPYLLLLISGGHTQFQLVRGVGDYIRLGTTIDDALGEAFDKTAKLLRLGYPGGPQVEAHAARGNAKRFALPRPLKGRPGCDFSFSGLKTAVRETVRAMEQNEFYAIHPIHHPSFPRPRESRLSTSDPVESLDSRFRGNDDSEVVLVRGGQATIRQLTDQDRADICASFELAVAETMADRLHNAFAMFREKCPNVLTPTLVVAGGVAANKALRDKMQIVATEHGFILSIPPFHLCTDNAAMIAWAGAERLALGLVDNLATPTRPRWPLDTVSAPLYGSGRLGAKA